MKKRGIRRAVVGQVVGSAMDKTIVVKAQRIEQHPRYHKYIRKTSTYKAHDERNEAKVGATVQIAETRPLSKTKHWRLVAILEQGKEEGQVQE